MVVNKVLTALQNTKTYALEEQVKSLEAKTRSESIRQGNQYGAQIHALEERMVKEYTSKIEETREGANSRIDGLGAGECLCVCVHVHWVVH